MAFKFRKRITLFPGFKINLSKSGMSATIGMRGMNVNIGKSGSYLNVGFPGTGIYDRVKLSENKETPNEAIPSEFNSSDASLKEKTTIEYKSFNPELVTSEGLFGLKDSIINAQSEKQRLLEESKEAKTRYILAKIIYVVSCVFVFGFFVKWFKSNLNEKKDISDEAQKIHENFCVDIEFDLDKEVLNEYIDVKNYFNGMMKCQSVWDVKTSTETDKAKERTIASNSITREKIRFEMSKLDFISSKFEALKMNNANGGDLYVYPGFVLLLNRFSDEFGIVDFRDINLSSARCSFVEAEFVPTDSRIVGRTWKYANKNGSPDKRFNNNYEIPIVLYSEFILKSAGGLNECYMISNYEIGAKFCEAFDKYVQTLKKMNWKKEK